MAGRGRPLTKHRKMSKLLTAKVLPEELAVLKRAAKHEGMTLSRWIVELALARAVAIGIRGAERLHPSPSEE